MTIDIENLVSTERLMAHAHELSRWTRTSGSRDEREAFEYIKSQLESFGYDVELHESDALIGTPGDAQLQVVGANARIVPAHGYAFGGSTPADGIAGDVIYLSDQDIAGVDPEELRGKIVLRDGIAMPDIVQFAEQAGAIGQIHINDKHFHEMCVSPVWGTPTPESVSKLPHLPVLSVLREDGDSLKHMLRDGSLRVRMVTNPILEEGKLPTLIASLDGVNDDTFVMFSGHVDAWHLGAMDNGTANSTQLEVARIMAQHRQEMHRGLRLAFWSGHSHSRYAGSAWYADAFWREVYNRCVCHVNIDSVGGAGASCLTEAASMAETYAFGAAVIKELTGQELAYNRMSRSSDQSFWGIGIPSLFAALSTQALETDGPSLGWWWHTPEDLIDKIDPANFKRDAEIYALAISRLCMNPLLPFDYEATASEFLDVLTRYESESREHFNLDATIRLSEELRSALADFPLDALEVDDANALMMHLGRLLIPVNYTKSGPYDQDPALSAPPIPGLRQTNDLAWLPDRDALYLRTALNRERNRVEHALAMSVKAVQAQSCA